MTTPAYNHTKTSSKNSTAKMVITLNDTARKGELPHDAHSERILISHLMRSIRFGKNESARVFSELPRIIPASFFISGHGFIWWAVKEMQQQNPPIPPSPETLARFLTERNYHAYLNNDALGFIDVLFNVQYDNEQLKHAERSVHIHAYRRSLIEASKAFENLGYRTMDDEARFSEVQQAYQNVTNNAAMLADEATVGDEIERVRSKVMDMFHNPDKVTYLNPEIPELSQRYTYEPETIITVGAYSSVGKSAYLTSEALNVMRQGKAILFLLLEMSEEVLIKRMASLLSGVSYFKINKAQFSQDELPRVMSAFNTVSELMTKTGSTFKKLKFPTPDAIEREIVLCYQRAALDMVFIDYIHSNTIPKEKGEDDRELMQRVYTRAEIWKARYQVPIMIAVQLNRGAANTRPQKDHIENSNAVYQLSDIVILLHRASTYSKSASEDEAEIIIAKNRNAPLGFVNVRFDGTTMHYLPLATGVNLSDL